MSGYEPLPTHISEVIFSIKKLVLAPIFPSLVEADVAKIRIF